MSNSEQPTNISELRGSFRVAYDMAGLLEKMISIAQETDYRATHDPLTGALNRQGLEEYLDTAKAPKALLLVDATNFKKVNDKLGYTIGDSVIGDTYDILKESVRPSDVIARWGGDEYIIVLNGENENNDDLKVLHDRRRNKNHVDYIESAKQRIATIVEEYLYENPDLRHTDIMFNLAVGGTIWPGNSDIGVLIAEAELDMKNHKATQHKLSR